MNPFSAMLALLFCCALPCCSDDLSKLRSAAWGGEWKGKLNPQEFRRAQALFSILFSNAETLAPAQASLEELGFELLPVHADGEEFLVLREQPAAKFGRGFFVIRKQARSKHLWMAPHSQSDISTGDLVMKLFVEGSAQAAAWNTVHRKQADLAHLRETYYQAFTQAFAELNEDGLILQLHGFDSQKRRTLQGQRGGIIVSDGTRNPGWRLVRFCEVLASRISTGVSLYPRQVTELGARTNVQGRGLRAAGHHGFIHFEVDSRTRKTLLADSRLRAQLLGCLTEMFP